MARIKLPSYIKEGHGKMDDAVIITRNGESYMKVYKKVVSKTEGQEEIRRAFKSVVSDWKYLSGIIRESWNRYTKGINASGYNFFMGANVSLRRAGEALELCRGMGEEIPMNFTASPGAASGEIKCEFLSVEPGRHITFFCRKEVEQGVKSPITRHDGGADAMSPFTIAGLESGSDYYVYAVITDAHYESALTVSQSVASLSKAG